jgi:hypothetical protein
MGSWKFHETWGIHLNEKKYSRWETLKICRTWEVVHRNSSSFGAWEEDHQSNMGSFKLYSNDHFCDVFVFWVSVREEDHQTWEVSSCIQMIIFVMCLFFWVSVSVPCLCLKLKIQITRSMGFFVWICFRRFGLYYGTCWVRPLPLRNTANPADDEIAKLGWAHPWLGRCYPRLHWSFINNCLFI